MQELNFAEWLQSLKEKCNIADVVRGYIELNKKGNNYWGCCPFHHEKTPSFAVNEYKNFYHCFGCGVSGDAIKFVQEMESQDFMGAVRVLAQKYNVTVPEFSQNNDITVLKAKKDRLFALTRAAGMHYYNNLTQDMGAEVARSYLERRGFGKDIITKFALGYSLGNDQIIKFLKSQGFTVNEMQEAGVVQEKSGQFYDALFKRLIVPIINSTNQVVGFGGRVLEKTDFAKYKNTQETVLFVKNKELYGVHSLKKFKQTTGFDFVIMVEGYMDVIALNKAGIGNCVASMGTSLTQEQARLLKRYADKVIISYDGDTAGQKATARGLDILQDAGLDVRVATMPEGKDPDEVIAQYGVVRYTEILAESLPLVEYKLRALVSEFDMSVLDEKSKFALLAIQVLKTQKSIVEKETYLPLVKELSGLPFDILQRQLYEEGVIIAQKPQKTDSEKIKDSAYHKAIRFVLISLFCNEKFAKNTENLAPFLIEEQHKTLYDLYCKMISEGIEPDESVLEGIENNQEAKILIKLKDTKMDYDRRKKYFDDSIRALKNEFIKLMIADLTTEYSQSIDAQRRSELLVRITELTTSLKK